MTTWKNLSKKTDIDLHFGETIDTKGERDPIRNGEITIFFTTVAEEELEENLQQRARSRTRRKFHIRRI